VTTIRTRGPHPTDLYVHDRGEGSPIVLIHGWPLSHRMWEAQVNALTTAGHRCIAYDRRGFGQSGHPAAGYEYDQFAADLDDLMVQLDLHDVTLVGFSMGGGEVVRYLSRHGASRVARAALLGSSTPFRLKTPDNPRGTDQSLLDTKLQALTTDRLGFLDKFFTDFYNADDESSVVGTDLIAFSKSIAWAASPLATQQCFVAFSTTDFRDDLRRIAIPTLVVHGDSDRIVPFEVSGQLSHELIVGSRLELIHGAPHGFAATHASQLNALLLDFIVS
jgi:non-heme chloroperoxidase